MNNLAEFNLKPMKILSVEKIRQADAYTIENEPIPSIDLMERAARRISCWIIENTDHKSVKIFCGMGNNGGDGLAVARHLYENQIDTEVFVLDIASVMSPDCATNYQRLLAMNVSVNWIKSRCDFPECIETDIVVDAVFGSGLNRRPDGLVADFITYINQSQGFKIAVDIPSGLYTDKPMKDSIAFQAHVTLTFQFPKLVFMFPESEFAGQWEVLDINLHPKYIEEVETPYCLLESSMISGYIRERPKFSHKGTYGHALLIAGSKGKTGAAILSAKAVLRSGAGLLTVHLPDVAALPMQISFPEAMISHDRSDSHFSELPPLDIYSAIGIGPGLGTDPETANALKSLIQSVQQPIVFDADALNILAANPTWLSFLPANSILTPHPKEFERLAGHSANSFEQLEKQRCFAQKYNVIVVLKGAHTSIALPNGCCLFNSTGNPGMATAGSGDVLTGIILSLLAQGYSPQMAAVIGVHIHGLAGDEAAKLLSEESVTASDIVGHIGNAFTILKNS